MAQLKCIKNFILSFLVFLQSLLGQGFFDEKLTTAGNIRMTINNLGMIGNAFRGSYTVLGYPSCEYPANSGVEHLFDGALWIGAKVNGTDIVVSTGAIDDASGYSTGKAGFEFTAELGSKIMERSTLLESPFYSPYAIAHQDFVADFTDRYTIVPGTTIPIRDIEQGPLYADIHFEAYNWNYSFANFFVILNYTIKNVGSNPWKDVYVGFWADPVVRNVNVTPAGSGGSAFYNKGGNGYIDSLYLAYEFDAIGDPGFTDSYFGLQFLGAHHHDTFKHPKVDTAFHVYFNSWTFRDFQSAYRTPINDNERYLRLSSGLNERPDWETVIKNQLKSPLNRSVMVSVGPFNDVPPGDSINVVFAVVCAKKYDDGNPTSADTDQQKSILVKNAQWAQAAFNGEDRNMNGILDPDEDLDQNGRITRYLLPAPPDIPKTRYVIDNQSIQIYWSNNAEFSVDPISRKQDFEGYRIYRTQLGFDLTDVQDVLNQLHLVAQFDRPNNNIGYDNGFEKIRLPQPITFPDDTTVYYYRYEIKPIQNGWQHAVVLTAFDTGDPENQLESLESSLLSNLKRIFPGMPPNKGFQNGTPFVYPNPYYGKSLWEGNNEMEENRRIIFSNLPPHCIVKIYNIAGELVYEFEHRAYQSELNDTEWYQTYSDVKNSQFSGGEHAWNLLSKDQQIIARGTYLFTVHDLDSGKTAHGKFVVIR